jgi:hypothetical protein
LTPPRSFTFSAIAPSEREREKKERKKEKEKKKKKRRKEESLCVFSLRADTNSVSQEAFSSTER